MLAFGISELILSLAILLVLSVTSLVCARIAKEKDRNVMMWAVLGAVFSFAAIAVVAALPRREVPVTPQHPTGRLKTSPEVDYRHVVAARERIVASTRSRRERPSAT